MSKDIIHLRLRELERIVFAHTYLDAHGERVVSVGIFETLEKVILSDCGTTNFEAVQKWNEYLAEAEAG